MSEDVNNNIPEEELLDNIIVLNDENGEEVPFEFLDLIELEGEEYVVLLPVEEDEDDDYGFGAKMRRGGRRGGSRIRGDMSYRMGNRRHHNMYEDYDDYDDDDDVYEIRHKR